MYAVDYPASGDFVPSANAGTVEANAHVNGVAASCPNTKLVLGGYSQGAFVIDQITIAQAPVAGYVPDILTADVADHVAALALFGNPSDRYLGAPVSTVSPWYGAKAIDLCAPGDPVCTGAMYTIPTHEDMSHTGTPLLSALRNASPGRDFRGKPPIAMRAVVITKHGPPSVLQVQDRPDPPPPAAGQVRIAVRAAGVNFADHLARVGLYPDAPKVPSVVGYEVAGTIEAVGDGVDPARVGQRVLAGTRFGGYAEIVNAGGQ